MQRFAKVIAFHPSTILAGKNCGGEDSQTESDAEARHERCEWISRDEMCKSGSVIASLRRPFRAPGPRVEAGSGPTDRLATCGLSLRRRCCLRYGGSASPRVVLVLVTHRKRLQFVVHALTSTSMSSGYSEIPHARGMPSGVGTLESQDESFLASRLHSNPFNP